MHAIRLVFGTAERGIDIPLVSPEFETNVPGIYIAGELGGMGLIRNAVEQGRQAMESIREHIGGANGADYVRTSIVDPSTAIPAESYPRYSRRRRPSSRTGAA